MKPNAKLEDIKRVNNEEPMPAHMLNKIQHQKSDPSHNVNNNNQEPQGQKPPSSNNANLPKPQPQQANLLFQKQPNPQNNVGNTPSALQRQPSAQNNIVHTPSPQQKREEPTNQAKQNYHYKNNQTPQPGAQQPQPQPQSQPYQGPKIVDASKFEKNPMPALSKAIDPRQPENKNIVPSQQKVDVSKQQYIRNPTADPKQNIQDPFGQRRQPDQKVAESKPSGQPLSLEKYNWLDNNNGVGNKPESKQDARLNNNAGNIPPNNNQPVLNRNKWINNPISNDPIKTPIEMNKSPSQQDMFRKDRAKIERPPAAQIVENQPVKNNFNPKQAPNFKNMAERDILGGFGGGVGGAAVNVRANNNNNNNINNNNYNNNNNNNYKEKKAIVLQDNFMKERQQNSNEKQISNEKQKLAEYEKKRYEEEKIKKDKNLLEEKKRKEKLEQERLENQKKREEERKSMLDEINKKRVSNIIFFQ